MTFNFFYTNNKLTGTDKVEIIPWPIDSLCFQKRFFFHVFHVWLSIQNCVDPSHGGKEKNLQAIKHLALKDAIWLDKL